MQFCNEQIRREPLFSPPCASATYGSARMCRRKNGGQGIDRRKMHSFEFGHLRGDYLGLNIVLRSFVMQRWISMKDHTTLCLHADFVATHAKPPLSLISRWNKEHDVDFWQPPDISCSHLYRGTFPWTPTTTIYRAYIVIVTTCITDARVGRFLPPGRRNRITPRFKLSRKKYR